MPWVLHNPSWILGSSHLLYHESNHQTSQWFPFSPILCSHCYSQYNMTKVEDNRMHWYLLGKCMLNAIQFPCPMVCSITMFGRLYQFCTKLFNKVFFRLYAFKITCRFTPHCNTIFHNKCQICTDIGFDVEGNPWSNFVLAISRLINC